MFRRRPGAAEYLLILDGHGNWGFPKGHREPGESAEATARREIREETGLDRLTCHAVLPELAWTFRAGRTLVRKRCAYFLFESSGGRARPQLEEGITRCAWLPCADALGRLTFPDAVELLEGAVAMVGRLRRPEPADRSG